MEGEGVASPGMHATAPAVGSSGESGPLPIAVGLTCAVVAVRLWLARGVNFCGTPDSCSYLALGESLSRHHGFVENFLYQYQMVDVHLPQRGIEYWRPGTSFLFLLAQPFGGVTLHSSLVVTILVAVVMAAAAWRIAWNATNDRRIACLAYSLCLALPPMWENTITPDSAVFYGAAAAWCLALFRVDSGNWVEDLLAWVCLAALNLIRNDAVLLVVPMWVVLGLRLRGLVPARHMVLRFVTATVAFGLALLPMMAISKAVLGHASASRITDALYLTDLTELMYYKQPLTLHTALAHGMGVLLKLRISVTAMIVYRLLLLMCGASAVLLPGLLLVRSDGRRRAWIALAGPAVFAATAIAVYGLALPGIGQFSALRSFNAVLPALAVAMAMAVVALCRSTRAMQLLGYSTVAFLGVSGVMGARRQIAAMNENGAQDRAVADYLAQHGASPSSGALIMAPNPAQFAVTTGYPTVPVPSNGPQATLEAVRDLHPTHVVVEVDPISTYADRITEALQPESADHVPGTRMLVLTMANPGRR